MILLTNTQRINHHEFLVKYIGNLTYDSMRDMWFHNGVKAKMNYLNGNCEYWFDDTKIETFILLGISGATDGL